MFEPLKIHTVNGTPEEQLFERIATAICKNSKHYLGTCSPLCREIKDQNPKNGCRRAGQIHHKITTAIVEATHG